MSVRKLRLVLFLLLVSGAFLLGGAAQLNPTVKLLPRPSGPAPAECEESLAPQPAQRIQVTEVVEQPRDTSRDLEPPPSRDLRSQIRDAQAAAEGNDRERFKEARASAKALLTAYPPGAERNGAIDVISVYDDLGRLWDYQFDTPSGSFFDAASGGGALLSAMNKYRGYEDFIRRQVLVVNGNRIYPTRETREFLTREAAQRLSRLGFPAPPRVAKPVERPRETEVSRPVVPTPRPAPPREITSAPKPRARKSSTSSAGRRPSVTPPSTRRASRPTPTEPAPGTSIVATSTTASVQPTMTRTTTPRQPIDVPVTRTTATETTATVAPFETMPPDTTSTIATSATTSAPATTAVTPPQRKGRNIILPLMLILIGIGVLIVLFRASS